MLQDLLGTRTQIALGDEKFNQANKPLLEEDE